jgi:C4-dicarboxylate-specific signal transduction histidine kinase
VVTGQAPRTTAHCRRAASIAHEVNQPLAAIVANSNAALNWLEQAEPDLGEVRAALRRIVKEGHRTGEIIASIRSMFGKKDAEKAVVDVNMLIGDVLSVARGELESHNVVLKCELINGTLQVLAERIQLQQVLINLVTNAIDAMIGIESRERLLVISATLCDYDEIEICIRDSGVGIDDDNMPHLFDAFFTTKPHGMGMGLSICRSIVEGHRGRLWAERGRPDGAAFFIRLPAHPPLVVLQNERGEQANVF